MNNNYNKEPLKNVNKKRNRKGIKKEEIKNP